MLNMIRYKLSRICRGIKPQNILLSVVIVLLFSLYVTYNTDDSLIASDRSDTTKELRTPRPLHGHESGDGRSAADNAVQQRNILEGTDQDEDDNVLMRTELPPIETTDLYKYIQQVS